MIILIECCLLLLTIGQLCNPLIHPGQNKDVQEIIKKFITKKKKIEECLEFVTVNNVADEQHEDVEAEHEWLIIIRLQVCTFLIIQRVILLYIGSGSV